MAVKNINNNHNIISKTAPIYKDIPNIGNIIKLDLKVAADIRQNNGTDMKGTPNLRIII